MKTLRMVCLVCLVCSFGISSFATEIRVRNDSKVEFKDVVVDGRKYGDIDPGVSTGYQTWDYAFFLSNVSLLADGKPLKLQLKDRVGAKKLGKGNFTYKLTINNGRLRIHAEKDAEKDKEKDKNGNTSAE